MPSGYLTALSANPSFDELAQYEEQRRRELIPQFQQRLAALRQGLGSQYDTTLNNYRTSAAARRAALVSSLTDNAKKAFELQNPAILEDLNSRGLASSPTTVAEAQAQALKQLEVGNQDTLNQFDTTSNAYEDALNKQKLQDLNEVSSLESTGGFNLEQDALNNALDLRRSQLEQGIADENTRREEALARDLARRQSRSNLTNSLIGVGGNLAGIGLVGRIFGGGRAAAAAPSVLGTGSTGVLGATGAGAGGIPLASAGGGGAAGLGALGMGGALAAGGIGSALLNRATQKKLVPALGQTGGQLAGKLLNPIGFTINNAKDLITNPKDKLQNIGNSIASPVKSVTKAVSKVFCFDGLTSIEMADGSKKPICEVDLDEETKGGTVESIRISKTSDGTMYRYKDVITTGYHAVKEGNQWVRVKDSLFGEAIPGDDTVYSLVTSKHRIYSNGIEFADEIETDDYENLTIDQSLIELNRQETVGVN